MRKWTLPFAAFVIAALPALSSAQQRVVTVVEPPPIRLEITPETGVMVPTNGAIADTGFAYGMHLGLSLARWLAVEGRYLGSSQDSNIGPGSLFFNSGAVDLKLMAPTGVGITPYATGGVGLYRFNAGALVGPGGPSLKGTNAEVPVGVGLMVDLSPTVGLGGEFMYHFLLDNRLFQSPGRSATDVWNVTANLSFRL